MDPELDRVVAKLCLLREAGGESLPAKSAVWHVILNRTRDAKNRWPKTVHQVVTQPYQFTSFNANDPGVMRWPNEAHPVEWAAWLECGAVVDSALLADPTAGANFYCDVSMDLGRAAIAWLGKGKTAEDLKKLQTTTIGRLLFFRVD